MDDKIYYVLTEYLTDKTEIYVTKFPDFGTICIMHPDKFPRFELEAIIAGYQLVDFREVDLLPIRRPLMARTEWTELA